MVPSAVITIGEYVDRDGHSPFAKWFSGLNAPAAAKVTTSLVRIEHGNFSNTKGVGAGLFECRIDFGPGYRIYFGKDGAALVILVGGGTKKHQDRDIRVVHEHWRDYKERKERI